MKIVMTGKSGLIGSAIYKRLIQNGNSVLSIGRREADDYEMDLNFFRLMKVIINKNLIEANY